MRYIGTMKNIRHRVEMYIALRLVSGVPKLPDVAAHFGMSQRTLARKLAKEGTTFLEVATALRQHLALMYLRTGMQITQMAWRLGYNETSSFSHACRKWTGKSPRELRTEETP